MRASRVMGHTVAGATTAVVRLALFLTRLFAITSARGRLTILYIPMKSFLYSAIRSTRVAQYRWGRDRAAAQQLRSNDGCSAKIVNVSVSRDTVETGGTIRMGTRPSRSAAIAFERWLCQDVSCPSFAFARYGQNGRRNTDEGVTEREAAILSSNDSAKTVDVPVSQKQLEILRRFPLTCWKSWFRRFPSTAEVHGISVPRKQLECLLYRFRCNRTVTVTLPSSESTLILAFTEKKTGFHAKKDVIDVPHRTMQRARPFRPASTK